MISAVPSPRVLVVDDNVDASEVLSLLIESEGFTADTAGTLAQARERIAQVPPHLIFLDMNLPDGNGLQLLASVKSDPKTQGIDVVMLSGWGDERVREEAHLLGASAYVVKPVSHTQLSELLGRVR